MNATNSANEKPRRTVSQSIIGCSGVTLGVLIFLLFVGYVISAFERPSLTSFGGFERWASFFANVVVAFYCFPAFKASKQRAFLYLAFAGLLFAYGSLFTLLFGQRLSPALTSRAQVLFYYGTRHLANTIGLVLYTWGVVLLARRALERGGDGV
jgi:hypothetical protein